jgi:hypothetical protein
MTAEEISKVAYQEPFKPFRMTLVTGESIEIKRRLRTTVAWDRVVLGVDEDPETGLARRMRMIALRDIVKVEAASVA